MQKALINGLVGWQIARQEFRDRGCFVFFNKVYPEYTQQDKDDREFYEITKRMTPEEKAEYQEKHQTKRVSAYLSRKFWPKN
jgi:hypothetical protein